MKSSANRDGVEIYIVSAYRSVERQVELIQRKLDIGQPLEDILEVLAPPGCSEHHTGRAIDIGTLDAKPLDPNFELSPAFSWLSTHAQHYGFQLSFLRTINTVMHMSLGIGAIRKQLLDKSLQLTSPDVSSGNAKIVPRSSFRCGFATESIAKNIK
jgi:D-alanyl-D-alanine carboxypeptidase